MEFIMIASAHFLALLSPGPDFFLITQMSLRHPLRYGLSLSSGIATGNGIYIILAIFGLETIRKYIWLTEILKYVGAAYLIFIGLALLLSRFFTSENDDESGSANGAMHGCPQRQNGKKRLVLILSKGLNTNSHGGMNSMAKI